MAVTWNYDGSGTLQVTIPAAPVGRDYLLIVWGGGSAYLDSGTGAGADLTLTATGITGMAAGDEFAARLQSDAQPGYVATDVFKYGTASATGAGFPVTWSYDGTTGLTATFATTTADPYTLYAYWYHAAGDPWSDTAAFTVGPGTITASYTLINTAVAGSPLIAFIIDEQAGTATDGHAVAARQFTQGVASDGSPGSPDTAGTDTGTAAGSGGGGGGPDPDAGGSGGVRIALAFDSTTLDPTPTWTYLTATPGVVAAYEITRGRQYEFDKTDTGTAKITINDQDGVLDPTNTTGPYFGKIEPLLQVQIELWNPVTSEWSVRFRGFVEGYDYDVGSFAHQDAAGNTIGNTRLEISCVDLFAILTAIEMQPDGSFGDVPPVTPNDATGNIFFDNAAAGHTLSGPGRIEQVLGNAAIDPAFYVVFTLNVNCQETIYSPSQNVLEVIQDAADAEFPTVSNVYCDRFGRLAVHGRLAKFDPAGVAAGASPGAWDFHSWKVGDGKAIAASPSDTAQIRSFAFNRGWDKIFNYALCTPKDIPSADIAAQVSKDVVSIAKFGFRSWSAESLIIGALTGDPVTGTPAGTLTGLDALDETKLYADFIVANYASPRNRITDISFMSLRPDDPRAATNWNLLCKVDISDLVAVYVHGPGDGPAAYIFNGDEFFVEGVRETAEPLEADYAMVTTNLDLSPRGYFTAGAWSGA